MVTTCMYAHGCFNYERSQGTDNMLIELVEHGVLGPGLGIQVTKLNCQ